MTAPSTEAGTRRVPGVEAGSRPAPGASVGRRERSLPSLPARPGEPAITWRHVAADRRKHVRVPGPRGGVHVRVAGEPVPVLDWSPGGVRVGVEVANDGVVVEVRVGDGAWEAPARRAWAAAGASGLAFTALPEAARVALVAAAGPWIAAEAGTPVEPAASTTAPRVVPAPAPAAPPRAVDSVGAPGEPAASTTAPRVVPAPPAPPPKRRFPLRAIVYLLLGALLTAWLGGALHRRVWRIEVDAATVIAGTARVASPADGVVADVAVREGDRVRAGDPLFRVRAAGVEAALERVTIERDTASAEVARLEAARAAAVEQLAIEGGVAGARAGAARRQVELLAQRLAWADAHVARVEALGENPGISAFDVDDVRARRAALAGELEAARARLAVEAARVGAARKGYAFDGERVAPALPEVDAALAAARTTLALAERRLAAEQARAAALQGGAAPFAGRVAEVLQPPGAAVRQGAVVVVLERDEDRQVEAWVTRPEAGYVRLGAEARVYVPGLGRTYDAVVRSIGAEAGASEQAAAVGVAPRLRVLLDLAGYAGEPDSAEAAAAELRAVDAVGLPAVVSLPRSWR